MAKRAPADPDKFAEASAWFRARTPVTKSEWDAMSAKARRQSFTVAGTQQLKVVQTVFDSLQRAIDNGTPIDKWRKEMVKQLGAEFTSRNAHTLDTAFINANQTAYNVGRYYQLNDPAVTAAMPYQMYDAVLDGRTSTQCLECAGTVLRHDDPWWLTHFPPLHHRCRSTVRALTAAMAKRKGITTDKPRPSIGDEWGLAPPLRAGQIWEPDRAKYDPTAFREYERKLARMKAKPANDNASKPRDTTAPSWMTGEVKVISERKVSDHGVNPAKILTLDTSEGTKQVVWKPVGMVEGEKVAKALAEREAAAAELDRLMHGEGAVVPNTVARKLGKVSGSMQEFVPGAQAGLRFEDKILSDTAGFAANESHRKTFLLDVLTANNDRHGGNVLWTEGAGGFAGHAIDNGGAFSKNGFRFIVNDAKFMETALTMDSASRKTIAALKLEDVDQVLRKYDQVTTTQRRDVLVRLQSLKNDSGQLAKLADADPDKTESNVAAWLRRSAKGHGLTTDQIGDINRIVK